MKSSDRSFVRRIDLMSLQLFVAVCELGSIGRAAEREFIAASAVSKRLSDLEAATGTTLLYRHSRGVRLTPAGESLLHHARTVLFGLEKMQSELDEYTDGVRGHVRVHANISAIVEFLPEDLGDFIRRHDGIKIDLEEHLSADVLHAVAEGAADIGICYAGGSAGGLQSLPYGHDRLMLIVPASHALASRTDIDFHDVLEHDIIGLHAGSSISLAMQQAAVRAGRPLKLRIQVTGLDAMCRMIDNGMGIGLLPDRAFALMQGVGQLHAIRLNDAWAARELRMVARDFGTLPTPARMLVDHLSAAARHDHDRLPASDTVTPPAGKAAASQASRQPAPSPSADVSLLPQA
ncbi:LysR family transcriptional regulator [Comamonadaceae bacterium PP-2]